MNQVEPVVSKLENTAVTIFKSGYDYGTFFDDGECEEPLEGSTVVDRDIRVEKSPDSTEGGSTDKKESSSKAAEWDDNRAKKRQELRRNSSILLRLEQRMNKWKMNWQWQRANSRQKRRDRPSRDSWLFSRVSDEQQRETHNSNPTCREKGRKWRERPSSDWLLKRGVHRSKMRSRQVETTFSHRGGFH